MLLKNLHIYNGCKILMNASGVSTSFYKLRKKKKEFKQPVPSVYVSNRVKIEIKKLFIFLYIKLKRKTANNIAIEIEELEDIDNK